MPALYEAGRQYARRARASGVGPRKAQTLKAVAQAIGVPREHFQHAMRFTAAVDLLAANCGLGAKRQLLSGHPRLSAKVVMQIARTHADRQRFALAQARAGRNPLGPPPEGVEPPFDTHNPAEVLSRLGRNAGALDKVADGLRDLPVTLWPKDEKIATVLDHATTIAQQTRGMQRPMKKAPTRKAEAGTIRHASRRGAAKQPNPFHPRDALRSVAAVAGVTRKNARDLPRVLIDTPPTEAEREALLTGSHQLGAAATRLAAVIRARGHDYSTGPSKVPGTYVVFFHLARPMKRLRIGALGTFDFPAGVFAYLGSAFGGGGVRTRTDRHLTRRSKEKWNIDHLKPHCTPVAVWWTHDRRKVEFDWAGVLESLPGASFPAMGFGAADNKNAKAHLVRFDEVPSFEEFQRRVSALVPDHADVHRVVVANWTGAGWPVCPTASRSRLVVGPATSGLSEILRVLSEPKGTACGGVRTGLAASRELNGPARSASRKTGSEEST